MSHLMWCEDVTVGTRLRYVGREFVVQSLQSGFDDLPNGTRLATERFGRRMWLHAGHTVWAMEETK